MLSSFVLANYYFQKFDDFIIDTVQPYFYGRYVDDMLLVFQRKILTTEELFKLFHTFKNLHNKNNGKNIELYFEKNNIEIKVGQNKFLLQNEKVKIFYLDKNYSIALLKKFKRSIEENKSIFLDLPECKSVFTSLEDNALNIMYDGSKNKVSSIKELKIDMLNISINLTFLIRILLLTKPNSEEKKSFIDEVNEQLKTIFSGRNVIELMRYWEKAFIYCFVSESFDLLKFIIKNINYHLEHLGVFEKLKISGKSFNNNEQIKNKIKDYIKNYFINSLSLAIATNYDFLTKNKKKDIIQIIESVFSEQNFNEVEIFQKAENLHKANLFKQYFNILPIINYLNFNFSNDDKKAIINK